MEPSGTSPATLDDTSNFNSDRDHLQACELQQINGGLMNQFVSGSTGGQTCAGFGPNCANPLNWGLAGGSASGTVGPYWALANAGALADRYFQPIAGGTASNDMYFAAAQFRFVDNNELPNVVVGENSSGLCAVPVCLGGAKVPAYQHATIGDLLLAGGHTFGIYADGYAEAYAAAAAAPGTCASRSATTECPYNDIIAHPEASYGCLYDPSDIPFLYFQGFSDYVDGGTLFPTPHEKDLGNLQQDLTSGTLPNFAFVKLRLYHNEHPNLSTISDGVSAVSTVVSWIEQSPYQSSTLVLLTWDEGGGFFDHVPPPAILPASIDSDSSGQPVPYGTRVPFLAIGPFAKANAVSHVPMEHSSIVRFLEFNFLNQEGALGTRDQVVNNIGSLLDPTAVGVQVPTCNSSCQGRSCGTNGCGTSCGACDAGAGCFAGSCATCGLAPNGHCAGAGQVSCGPACCSSNYPFYCASNNACYATADGAAAACASNCTACSTACVNAVPSGGCAAGTVDCGSGICCPSANPFYCSMNALCYATAAAAVASPCAAACLFCQ